MWTRAAGRCNIQGHEIAGKFSFHDAKLVI